VMYFEVYNVNECNLYINNTLKRGERE
jgi:hypothetical protein